MTNISHIEEFLGCATPKEWLAAAEVNLGVLLIDHAHCEKKAASTALSLMSRYVDRKELLAKLSQLAREELLHFEQVLEMMGGLGVEFTHLTASRYAKLLRKDISTSEPMRLVDTLIVGGIIEARSCERFSVLAPQLLENENTEELGRYYRFLLKSESRHFEDYLALARLYSPESIDGRVEYFLAVEKQLIEGKDDEFRFHSGVPVAPFNQ
ncbi:tRNA-(ms[2]io[6]A)-hydroxylase [Gammaproteobacteria bacterium 45_16_T64]|nr:tRNA-(ms[2]io[6]A)-hydroxylase [Gammaproteobacteria bacterium 45_16_T64]